MPDPAAIFARIQAEPDAERHWHTLAEELRDGGEYDLAHVLRGYWRGARDRTRDAVTAEQAVGELQAWCRWDLTRVARQAREAEEEPTRIYRAAPTRST